MQKIFWSWRYPKLYLEATLIFIGLLLCILYWWDDTIKTILASSILSILLLCTICVDGIQSAVPPTESLLNSSSSSINCSDLSHYKWISDPPQDLPINSALLSGAKYLLKADYTYSEDAPDYLPSSYTEIRNNTTNYVIHAYEPTHVYWRLDGDHLLKWESQPGGWPSGWSAIVTTSSITTDLNQANATQCVTDCSGLMTALLCYANTQHPTIFKGWNKGSSVPVAGCRDPYGGCQEPNPVNYYRFFSQNLSDDQGRKEFQKA